MFEFCTHERNIAPPGADAQLEVQIQLLGGHGESLSGRIFATPFMISDEEVDYQIDQIIEGLNRVRDEAKARLSENKP